MLTTNQVNEIKKVVEKYMNVLMEITTGTGKPDEKLMNKLNVPKELRDIIDTSYKYGKLCTLRGNQNLENLTEEQVRELIKHIKLTPNQKKSLKYIKLKTGTHISGLSDRMTAQIVSTITNNELQGIQEVVGRNMEQRNDKYKVVQELRELTQDWERDWHRVAHTEMWDAKVNGEVMAILDGESPFSNKKGETMVFKRPGPNACNQCKKHYLESDGKTPKVFKLSELIANGTNYGKKTAEWKPVVGVMHPNCMCPLSVIPEGYTFDSNGQLIPNN